MIRSPIKRRLREPIRSALIGFSDEVSRYFTELKSTLNSYYEFTDTVTLSGDFEIEVDFVKTDSDNNKAILGQIGSGDDYLAFISNQIRLNIDGSAAVLTPAAPYLDGKIHTIRVVRIGTAIEMFIDDVSVDTGVSSAILSIDYVGALNTPTFFYGGYIVNLKITGSTLVDSPLDGAPDASYEVNKAATLGSELVVNGTFDTDITGWSDTSSAGGTIAWNPVGAIDLINTTGTSRALQDIATEVGKVYKLEIVNTSNSNGSYEIGSVTGAISANSTTVVFYKATSTTTDVQLKNFNVGTTVTVSTITLQEIPASTPYLIRQNIATEQVKKFDEVADGWTGPELANNTLIPVDTLDAFTNLEVTSGLVFGVVYKAILEIGNYSSGSLKINSTGTDSPFYSANGVYILDVDDATSISAQTGAGGFTGSYRLSVKEFLEEA